MEQLRYTSNAGTISRDDAAVTLVGVAASGNLEILIERADLGDRCEVEISTAATGFGEIWNAVLADFFERHALANLRISINDVGATPAVVSLRLDQAVEEYLQASR